MDTNGISRGLIALVNRYDNGDTCFTCESVIILIGSWIDVKYRTHLILCSVCSFTPSSAATTRTTISVTWSHIPVTIISSSKCALYPRSPRSHIRECSVTGSIKEGHTSFRWGEEYCKRIVHDRKELPNGTWESSDMLGDSSEFPIHNSTVSAIVKVIFIQCLEYLTWVNREE